MNVDTLESAAVRLRQKGAQLAEIRHLDDEREWVAVRDGAVERLNRAGSQGFGVRVLIEGAWGFAARPGSDPQALEAACGEALAVARAAAALGGGRTVLTEEEPSRGRWATPVDEDPFAVPVADKLRLALAATEELRRHAGERARSTSAHIATRRQKKRLAHGQVRKRWKCRQ